LSVFYFFASWRETFFISRKVRKGVFVASVVFFSRKDRKGRILLACSVSLCLSERISFNAKNTLATHIILPF
ncbi:MAG TPA: hypothetical protein PLD87_02735, partial [Bacteroidia bacterium]|nr:hypothetical protein [Bacteroidia bacterium]